MHNNTLIVLESKVRAGEADKSLHSYDECYGIGNTATGLLGYSADEDPRRVTIKRTLIMLYTLNLYSAECQLYLKTGRKGNSLAVQWLELRTCTAEGPGSILGQGTKIPQAAPRGQKNWKKKT